MGRVGCKVTLRLILTITLNYVSRYYYKNNTGVLTGIGVEGFQVEINV